jgi:transcriptional regulator with PAS, ATPase and Fis domain
MEPTTEVGFTADSPQRPQTAGTPRALQIAWHPDARHSGAVIALTPGVRLVLGRAGEALGSGRLDDPRLSRQHCSVEARADGGVVVADLGSTNGTTAAGVALGTATLHPGDTFVAGQILFVIVEGGASVQTPPPGIVGRSAELAAVLDQVALVAPRKTAVLLLGESGTGKEVFAHEVHRQSGRTGTMVAVNCGGVADGVLQSELFGHVRGAFSGADRVRPGLVEQARGGTLFLDEVGDASPALQVTLLRLLQEGEYRPVGGDEVRQADVRCVAATNVDLVAAITAGRFRQDLYTRLSRWTIALPPLRQRPADLVPLVATFVERHRGPGARPSRRFMEALLAHRWPGNVRELDAVVERACVAATGPADALVDAPEWLLASLRPQAGPPTSATAPAPAPAERDPPAPAPKRPAKRPDAPTLTRMLAEHGGEMKSLAQTLGVGRTTLYRWFEAAGLDPEALRGGEPGEPGQR